MEANKLYENYQINPNYNSLEDKINFLKDFFMDRSKAVSDRYLKDFNFQMLDKFTPEIETESEAHIKNNI